jgi:hypothetical protein
MKTFLSLFERPSRIALPILFCFLGVFATAQSARADGAETYTYAGNPLNYSVLDYNCPTVCEINGSFTVAQPLAPNLSFASFTPTAFSFTDGITTYTQLNTPPSQGIFYDFSTDSSGAITGWAIFLQMLLPPTPNGYAYTQLSSSYNFPYGGSDASQVFGPGINAFAINYSPGTWTAAPAAVATIPEPASLWLLAAGLAAISGRRYQTRRRTGASRGI